MFPCIFMQSTPFPPDSYRDFPQGGKGLWSFPLWGEIKRGVFNDIEMHDVCCNNCEELTSLRNASYAGIDLKYLHYGYLIVFFCSNP